MPRRDDDETRPRRYKDEEFLSPETPPKRHHSKRRHRSRDRDGHSRRHSPHPHYHSDDEIRRPERKGGLGAVFGALQRELSASAGHPKSREPSPRRAPRVSRHQVPSPTRHSRSSRKQVPSPPPVKRYFKQAPDPQWHPPGAPSPLPAPPASPPLTFPFFPHDSDSEARRERREGRKKERSRERSHRVAPSPPRNRRHPPISLSLVPDPYRSKHSSTAPANTSTHPVVEQPPSPPATHEHRQSLPLPSHHRSRSFQEARLSLPVQSLQTPLTDDEAGYHGTAGRSSPNSEPRGTNRSRSNTRPLSGPSGFASVPETLVPDDSRSELSRFGLGGHASSSRPGSVALSSSIARPQQSTISSSGVLGPKVYQYSLLGERQFRLVAILPARSSTIKCELRHESLDNPPTFTAISYAWGDADDTRRILLEETNIRVAASLHGALRALREKRESVLVWVDALSIDQQNKDERTQQVPLMTEIYTKAQSVAIWLGPESDDSNLALQTLEGLARRADSRDECNTLIAGWVGTLHVAAIVALFERDYWRRLWVVQEVYNARDIMVYCGGAKLHWSIFRRSSYVFGLHKPDIDRYFPATSSQGNSARVSQNQYTYSQVLVYEGPSRLLDVSSNISSGEETLLEVMRLCRGKLSADPRDKVFGILGVLPEEVRREFTVDYNRSLKDVYVDVVDTLIHTTERLDAICESIHFPIHTSSVTLPSWVPDWSYNPATTALGTSYNFAASGTTPAEYRLLDEHERRKLEITAVSLGTITTHGIAVGTLCTLADYLMAFLHWRALLLGSEEYSNLEREEEFCRTLCLDQVPSKWKAQGQWLKVTYHLFSSLMRDRIPRLPLDHELRQHIDTDVGILPEARRRFLQDHFGAPMMGRCICLTNEGHIGMGSGFMTVGDEVVVPLGCSTPIILRPEGSANEYRFVGDVYIHGYMHGKAMAERERTPQKFVLH